MFIDVAQDLPSTVFVGGGTAPAPLRAGDGGWPKRALDVVGAAALLLVFAPLLLALAALVLVSDGHAPFFTQQRAGLLGRPFALYKLRTMVPDAEARKAALADRNERTGPAFKLRDDPRVTPVGRFLRRTSLDELPQLLNVLQGHMSLVGPRPATTEEVAAYLPRHRTRLAVKPGLTGLWQVTARDDPDFERWVEIDLRYIRTRTLWLDLRLLALTPLALFRHPGR